MVSFSVSNGSCCVLLYQEPASRLRATTGKKKEKQRNRWASCESAILRNFNASRHFHEEEEKEDEVKFGEAGRWSKKIRCVANMGGKKNYPCTRHSQDRFHLSSCATMRTKVGLFISPSVGTFEKS